MLRKAEALRRRAQARAAVARIARADPTFLYGGHPSYDLARRHAPAWPSARAPREYFQRVFPASAAYAVTEADHILEGRLRLFGRLEDVSRPDGLLDWEFRPTDDRATQFGADPKFPWEVARHAALPRLGVAWSVTREARYADRAAALVLDWSSRYAEADGIHWSSALEVGIRLIAWCQAFHFFRSSAAFKGPAIEALLRHVAAMAVWLDGHLSTDRVVAGNHLLGELAGLIVADLYFPEMGEEGRLARNLQLFATEVERQVARDGVSREQSSTYGRFVGDFIVAVLAAARSRGALVPEVLRSRAAALAVWLAALTRETGTLPLIGDHDDGKGVDWGEPYPCRDPRGVILAIATMLDQPAALAHLAGRGLPPGSELVFWWMGEEGVRRLDQLLSAAPGPPTVHHFPVGGHAVVRRAYEDGGDYLHIRCGPFGHGLPKPSAHSHADWMSPSLTLGGAEILVDPGNFGYTTVGPDRALFRIDQAHNIFRVGGRPMASPGDAFRWIDIPKPGRLLVSEDERTVSITGLWSPAALRGEMAVACQRTLTYNKLERYVDIADVWSTDPPAPSPVVWFWHFPPGTDIRVQEGGAGFEAALPDGVCFVFELSPIGSIRIESGWVAPMYSERRPAPVVVVDSVSNEPGGRQVFRLRRAPVLEIPK